MMKRTFFNATVSLLALFGLAPFATPSALAQESAAPGPAVQMAKIDMLTAFRKPQAWKFSPEGFLAATGRYGFTAAEGKDPQAVSTDSSSVSFAGQPVREAKVLFDGPDAPQPGVRRIEISFHETRGHGPGDWGGRIHSAAEFNRLLDEMRKNIEAQCGKGSDVRMPQTNPRRHASRTRWDAGTMLVQLDAAYTDAYIDMGGQKFPFVTEYFTATMVPRGTGVAGLDGTRRASTAASAGGQPVTLFQLASRVKKDPASGDVYIPDIPMVVQGERGNAAAATSERVLRYYGIDVSKADAAQLTDTAARESFTLNGLAAAVQRIAKDYKFDSSVFFADGNNFKNSSFADDIKDYNQIAKKRNLPKINVADYTRGHMINLGSIYEDMDPAILLEARVGNKQEYKKFQATVHKFVDSGVPLFWSVLVGMYPEDPPIVRRRGAMGHMRLIVGYNEKERQILYSDALGDGHELKRMPMDQAWAMTRGLLVMKPKR